MGSVPLIVLVILPSEVVRTQGQFCPPDDIWYVWGHLIVITRVNAISFQRGGARNAAKHIVYSTTPITELSDPHVSTAKIEKPLHMAVAR